GCENSTAHESPIHSWKLISPSVVCASKSGAVSLIVKLIRCPLSYEVRAHGLLWRTLKSTLRMDPKSGRPVARACQSCETANASMSTRGGPGVPAHTIRRGCVPTAANDC